MTKKYRAKQYPLYSIQFFRDKRKGFGSDVINLFETSNIPDGTEPLRELDLHFHGLHIARSELLTKGDKESLASFCKAYLENYKLVV